MKGIAVYNDAMELTGGVVGAEGAGAGSVGVDFEVPTLAKLAIAIPVAAGMAKSLESRKKSGALDVAVSALGMVESGINFGSALVSGKGAREIIKKVPALGASGLGLVEKAAKYVGKTYEKDPSKTAQKDGILQNLAAQIKAYNKEVEEYKTAKDRKLLAVKKPKAPPYITAKNVFEKLKELVDYYEEGSVFF